MKLLILVAYGSFLGTSLSLYASSNDKLTKPLKPMYEAYDERVLRENIQSLEARKNLYEEFLRKNRACENDSPIFRAVLAGDHDKLKSLLVNAEDSKITDKNGITPLRCAVFLGKAECARILFEKGARLRDPVPLEASHPEGLNLADVEVFFMFASTYDNVELMRALLKYEASFKKNKNLFLSLLGGVAIRGSSRVLKLFLDSEKKFEFDDTPYLQVVLSVINVSPVLPVRLDRLLKPFIQAGLNVQSQDHPRGLTLLHAAACADGIYSASNIHELIKAGAQFDVLTQYSNKIPLGLAVECGIIQNVRTLIFAGANVDAKANNRFYPVHVLGYATEQGTLMGKTLRRKLNKFIVGKLGQVIDLPDMLKDKDYDSQIVQLLTEAGEGYPKKRLIIFPLWKNDFDHIIALLSGGARIDESEIDEPSLQKVKCFDDLKRLSKCLQTSNIPSALIPKNYFIEQQPLCLNVCSAETQLLEGCISSTVPLITTGELATFSSGGAILLSLGMVSLCGKRHKLRDNAIISILFGLFIISFYSNELASYLNELKRLNF